MSQNKRYYWIKLKTNFFNLDEIDFLLSQTNGCEYIVLYQMLCLNTANSNGELRSKVGEMIIPYDIDKIVRETRYFNRDTIIVALELFKKLNLIYTQEDNILRITNFDDMVGSETKWAEQKRNQRKQKKLSSGQIKDNVLQEKDNQELELDKEKESKENRMKENMKNVYLKIEKLTFFDSDYENYKNILVSKNLYTKDVEYMFSEDMKLQIKLFQIALKRLVDFNQTEVLSKVNIEIMQKVFLNITKVDNVENVEEYYIQSLINEVINENRKGQ